MRMENLILQQISVSDFKEIISDTLREEIRNTISTQPSQEQYLTRKETAKLLQISLVTLWSWSKDGIIQSYTIGSRVRYKKSDIDNALKAKKNLKYRRNK